MYSLSIDYLEYYIMFVCDLKVSILSWSISGLQQVNQLKGALGPFPQQAYSTECLFYLLHDKYNLYAYNKVV